MRASDRDIRIVAALIVATGLAACGLAIFSEQLGLGAQTSPGTFGWRRMALLAVGAIVLAAGALLWARPGILSRVVDWEQMRPLDHKVRIAGALLAASGAAASGVAIFAEQLGLGAEAARGEFGWKQISLLAVGAVVFAVGAVLLARPRIAPMLVTWLRSVTDGRHRPRLRHWEADRFSQRMRWQIDVLGLLFVLGVYGIVQFLLVKPPALSDQIHYFVTADALPDAGTNHRELRIGLLFPVRGAIELFGYSEAAYYAVPFLSGLALAGFTYFLARMLFGWAVAVAAALLVTLNPYVLWDSSHLLPDVPAAAAFVGAMAALVGAGILHRRLQIGAWTVALLVAGGFLLGWAYLTREYLLVMFPIVLVVFVAYRIPWRRLGWVALGAAPPLILELVWGIVNYGDPLIRFITTTVERSPTGSTEGLVMNAWDVIWQLPSHFLNSPGGWVFVLLFFGLILYGSFAAIRGDRRFLPLVAWVAGLWLFLTLVALVPIVTQGESAFLRLQKLRYWLPIMPGLVIGGVAVVGELIRILARSDNWVQPLSLASLAAITFLTLNAGISSISHSPAFVRNASDQYLELRDFLRAQGASYSTLYTDQGAWRSLGVVLPMYTRATFGSRIWQGDIRGLARNTEFLSVDEIEGELVVVGTSHIRDSINRSGDGSTPPAYLLDPPPNWQPVMISHGGGIVAYRIAPDRPLPRLHLMRARDWYIEGKGSHPEAAQRIENGRAVIELATDDPVLVFAGREGRSGPPARSDEGPINAGEAIWGRVQMASEGVSRTNSRALDLGVLPHSELMASEGFGSAKIRCFFYGPEGRTVTSDAAARKPYTDHDLESIDYRCRAPRTGGPFSVRVAIEARGVVKLTLGENAVHAAPGESLSG